MGRGTDYLPNPFLDTPAKNPGTSYQPLSLREQLALEAAPKRPGTSVRVRAYRIPGLGPAKHMYVEYDDGRERLIARGGPSGEGPDFVRGVLSDNLHVTGGVTPAYLSRDYAKGGETVFSGYLPGVSAQAAAAPARREAQALAKDPRRYRGLANSNSYAADTVEPLFGVRPGDPLTPGYKTRLDEAPRARLSPLMSRVLTLLP